MHCLIFVISYLLSILWRHKRCIEHARSDTPRVPPIPLNAPDMPRSGQTAHTSISICVPFRSFRRTTTMVGICNPAVAAHLSLCGRRWLFSASPVVAPLSGHGFARGNGPGSSSKEPGGNAPSLLITPLCSSLLFSVPPRLLLLLSALVSVLLERIDWIQGHDTQTKGKC